MNEIDPMVQLAKDSIETPLSRTHSDIKILKVREGTYKALVHVEHDFAHVTYSSQRVDSKAKADAVGKTANEMLIAMLESLATPQE